MNSTLINVNVRRGNLGLLTATDPIDQAAGIILEIVEYGDPDPSPYPIAVLRGDSAAGYNLQFINSGPLRSQVDWAVFRALCIVAYDLVAL